MTATAEGTPEVPAALERPVAAPRACVFRCGGLAYALPVVAVREVALLPQVTPVPRMPPQIRGVANLRGTLLPVVDPAVELGHGPGIPGPVTPTIVVRDGTQDVGLAVDAIDGLVPMDLMIAAPAGLPAGAARLARGAFVHDGRPVVLLDGSGLVDALRPVPADPPPAS